MQQPNARLRLFGLVRDAAGKPKIDGDPTQVHPCVAMQMTAAEREAFGVSLDPCAIAANGISGLTRIGSATYRADVPIVGLREVWDGEELHDIKTPSNFAAGATFTLATSEI